MSISFGSTGKKPYVGSKEVKEAYVGSQLVYRAVPPYVYGFLGAENDYILSDWVILGDRTNIAKYQNIYRIQFGKNSDVRINLTPRKGSKINIALAQTKYSGKSVFKFTFYKSNGSSVPGGQSSINLTADQFQSFQFTIPATAEYATISASYESSTSSYYADMIYCFD